MIKHSFVSAKTDSGDTTKLGPNAWNAEHAFDGGANGNVLTRDTGAASGASWAAAAAAVTLPLALADGGTSPFGAAGTVLVGGATPAWSATPALTSVKIGTGANLTSPGDGRLVLTNNAVSRRVMFETTLDAKLRLLNFDASTFAELECGAATFQGNAVFNGTNTFNSNIIEAAAGAILWSGRGTMRSPANARFTLTNAAESTGVGFDVGTDSILKLHTKAHDAQASLECLNVTLTGLLKITDGNVGAPGLSFVGEPTSGWYRGSAGIVSLAVLGVQRFSADTVQTSLHSPNAGAYFRVSNGICFVNSATLCLGSGGTIDIILVRDAANTLAMRFGTAAQRLNLGQGNTSLAAGRLAMGRDAEAAFAPGAGYGMLRWETGTNAGTLKLMAYSGTSATGVTVLDNIGGGN